MILDEVEHRVITPTDATTKNLLFILMYAIISSITQDFNFSFQYGFESNALESKLSSCTKTGEPQFDKLIWSNV